MPTTQSAVAPVVDLNAKSKTATAATTAPARTPSSTMLILAGAVLALLILGGIAAAVARRRRRVREEEWAYDEPMAEERAEPMAAEPFAEAAPQQPFIHEEQPAIVAPAASAFSFGPRDAASDEEPMVEPERRPGETWIERAYRGPSPSNPSVSLKNRLRRAAFFDKRERDAAAGRAEPINTSAGLPDAMVEEQERENA